MLLWLLAVLVLAVLLVLVLAVLLVLVLAVLLWLLAVLLVLAVLTVALVLVVLLWLLAVLTVALVLVVLLLAVLLVLAVLLALAMLALLAVLPFLVLLVVLLLAQRLLAALACRVAALLLCPVPLLTGRLALGRLMTLALAGQVPALLFDVVAAPVTVGGIGLFAGLVPELPFAGVNLAVVAPRRVSTVVVALSLGLPAPVRRAALVSLAATLLALVALPFAPSLVRVGLFSARVLFAGSVVVVLVMCHGFPSRPVELRHWSPSAGASRGRRVA